MVDKATDTDFLQYFPQDELPELLRNYGSEKETGHPATSSRPSSAVRPQSAKRPLSAKRPQSAKRTQSAVTRPPSAKRPPSAARPASASAALSDQRSPSRNIKGPTRVTSPSGKKSKSPTRPASPSKIPPLSPNKTRPLSPSKQKAEKDPKLKSEKDQKLKSKSPTPGKTTSKSKLLDKAKEKQSKSSDITDDGLKKRDASSQGMIAIPTNILSDINLGDLNLSSNNLRALPTEINKLIHLRKLDLSKNGIKCLHQKDFSGLPAEFGELKSLKELYISECNLPFIPPAILSLSSLTVLDISRNKINILPSEISELRSLVKLNLQQTNISYLPSEIACCQDLEELLLYGNKLESLPETLADLPKLRVLAVNYRSFCNVLDSYMESLISKGQINSEHIPLVVFELPALQNLDLECTKINTVPEMFMDKLQEFSLYKNFINEMPETIYKLTSLQVFDISKNYLKVLPSEVSEMIHLTVLRVNDNSLDKIPCSVGKLVHLKELEMGGNRIRQIPKELKHLTGLKRLVLDRNDIQALPEEICALRQLETLDVAENSIQQIPIMLYNLNKLTVAHTYKGLRKHGLWLYKNPLKEPPEHIWKTDKPQDIFNYLKKLQISRTENLQRQKIVLLGCSGAGKSSLVDALVLGKATASDEHHNKTKLLDQIVWHSADGMSFLVYDLAGDSIYSTTYPLFLDPKAFVIVVFDMSTYNEKGFYECIGKWLDLVQENIPRSVVQVVGTKSDLCEGQGCDPDSVWIQVTKHINKRKEWLKEELIKIEEEGTFGKDIAQGEIPDSDLLPERQEDYLKGLLSSPLKLLPGVKSISSSDSLQGIQDLVHHIEISIIDKDLFPDAQRYIPDQWNKLKAALKRRKSLYLHWTEVEETGKRFHVKGVAITECIQYLQDIGEVFWLKQLPGLQDVVFQRPRALVDVISTLYRHDVDDFLIYDQSRIFSSKGGLTNEEFDLAKYMFSKFGQISRPLLNCLWFYLELDNQTFTEYLELLPKLNLCYCIPEPMVPPGKCYLSPLLVLPRLNTELLANPEHNLCTQTNKTKQVILDYSFPLTPGEGMHEIVATKIQDLLLERTDWQNAIFGTMQESVSVVFIKTPTEVDNDIEESHIKLHVSTAGDDLGPLENSITQLYCLIEGIFTQKPGLYSRLSVSTINYDSTRIINLLNCSDTVNLGD